MITERPRMEGETTRGWLNMLAAASASAVRDYKKDYVEYLKGLRDLKKYGLGQSVNFTMRALEGRWKRARFNMIQSRLIELASVHLMDMTCSEEFMGYLDENIKKDFMRKNG